MCIHATAACGGDDNNFECKHHRLGSSSLSSYTLRKAENMFIRAAASKAASMIMFCFFAARALDERVRVVWAAYKTATLLLLTLRQAAEFIFEPDAVRANIDGCE